MFLIIIKKIYLEALKLTILCHLCKAYLFKIRIKVINNNKLNKVNSNQIIHKYHLMFLTNQII